MFAYADLPYPGMSGLYKDQDDFAGEVDHKELLSRLCEGYPDGWALSTASTTLQYVLALCPPDVRVMAWVKPFAAWKKNVYPAYAWEPVIVRGGRKLGYPHTVRDWIAANITLKRGLTGAKPEAFCYWLFAVLGIEVGDDLHDLYPGTGAVSEALQRFSRGQSAASEQVTLFMEEA